MISPNPDLEDSGDGLEHDGCEDAVVANESAVRSCPSGDPLLHEALAASKAHLEKHHRSKTTESYRPLSAGAHEAIVAQIEDIQEAERDTLRAANDHGASNPALAYADRAIARGYTMAKASLRRLLTAETSAAARLVERRRVVAVDVDCVNEALD
jgi:hypothetical protein